MSGESRFAALVIAGLAFVSIAPASAQTTAVPYHQAVWAGCTADGVIRSNAPRDVRPWYWYSSMETVKWSSDLYKYTSNGWQVFDNSKPWLEAMATTNGLVIYSLPLFYMSGIWFRAPYGATYPVPGLVYSSLTRGSYAVMEYYRWPSGYVHRQWSTFNGTGSTVCAI